MPELPEVETVCQGLNKILIDHPQITSVKLMREDIRDIIPPEIPRILKNQPILGVRRRAKYILFDTPRGILLNHLGMTGSWREVTAKTKDIHDHCYITLSNGKILAFRDPRRFGILDWIEPGNEASHSRLLHLGPEPFDPIHFTPQYLFAKSRSRRVAVKTFIMNQEVVVGVGNIYASEVLFAVQLHPKKQACHLTLTECTKLVASIDDILKKAIAAGGSSIQDYRQASGESGSFQQRLLVYDRAGEKCARCQKILVCEVIGGRSSFWCPSCQKMKEN